MHKKHIDPEKLGETSRKSKVNPDYSTAELINGISPAAILVRIQVSVTLRESFHWAVSWLIKPMYVRMRSWSPKRVC